MNSVLVSILEAVKSILNDPTNQASLSQTFIAERIRIPEYDTATTPGLKVYVLGLSEGIEFVTRGQDDCRYGVKVAIYKQVANEDEADAMDYFREQVCDLLRAHRSVEIPSSIAALTEVSCDPVYDPANYDQHNTFVSVIGLEYRLPR